VFLKGLSYLLWEFSLYGLRLWQRRNLPWSQFESPTETSAKAMANRSGGSVERRKLRKNEECGFLPKAATPVLQRSPSGFP
jgi:hypothetical protein